jgi:hypothetical protein
MLKKGWYMVFGELEKLKRNIASIYLKRKKNAKIYCVPVGGAYCRRNSLGPGFSCGGK